ncbi:hypothetical protein [Bifidobacterium sp.]|uniref:hypothetical protein n=1 Tax=Bifidobacterium sp. TaxID=41200 RepID=UPI003D7D7655
MYKAIEVIPKSSASRLVSADEINDKFHGDVPRMIRFVCPYCNRPVNSCAMHTPRKHMRNARAVSPYFRHQKNDPWTLACPEHSTGANGGTLVFHASPSLPMFLHKRPDGMFDIEISVHPHPTGREPIQGKDDVLFEGKIYRPAQWMRSGYDRITLSSPNPDLSEIHVPRHLKRTLGYVENGGNILIFTDIYGSNGGKKISRDTALHPDRSYYIVAKRDAMKGIRVSFDQAAECGCLAGNRELIVRRVQVHEGSPKCDSACRWLYQYGYTLSEIDMAAHPVWPPVLRSSGVDEPLFRNSNMFYKTPYMMTAEKTPARPRSIAYGSVNGDARAVKVIGLGRRSAIQKALEGDCLFIRFGEYQAWNALIVVKTDMRGLSLMPAPDDSSASGMGVETHAINERMGKNPNKKNGTSESEDEDLVLGSEIARYTQREKPRFGEYSRASVCMVRYSRDGSLEGFQRIMDYIGQGKFKWTLGHIDGPVEFTRCRPISKETGQTMPPQEIETTGMKSDFVLLRWTPGLNKYVLPFADPTPGLVRNCPAFYEAIDLTEDRYNRESQMSRLDEGIRYEGHPTERVLVIYKHDEDGQLCTVLLDRKDLVIRGGVIKLGDTAKAYSPSLTVDSSLVRIISKGSSQRMICTTGNPRDRRIGGFVRLRPQWNLAEQYIRWLHAMHPEHENSGRFTSEESLREFMSPLYDDSLREEVLARASMGKANGNNPHDSYDDVLRE